MEENRHHQRALEALTRTARPKSSVATIKQSNDLDSEHSIWSDDAASTRRIPMSGGIDSRFNHIDLGEPVNSARTPSRPFSVSVTGPDNHGVEIIWDARRDADVESQYSTDTATEQQKRISRFSRAFTFWQRLRGDGGHKIAWLASLKAFATFTWLNVLLIFVPLAWGIHYTHVSHVAKFILTFIAIIPLSKILEYGGEQLALYCGKAIGDLIIITLNNAVETILAVVLLMHCDLKLLQSTVIGVVLLRLLLVPGSSFFSGGTNVFTQDLHPHIVTMNNTLLTVGALTLLLPAAFFSGLDRMVPMGSLGVGAAITDSVRGDFLKLSRALAIFLLLMCVSFDGHMSENSILNWAASYVGSRVYLHNPPGDNDSLQADVPESFKADVAKLEEEEPEVNPFVCIIVLLATVVLLGFTSELLVDSVKPMRTRGIIQQEYAVSPVPYFINSIDKVYRFFGIVLLPMVSYSADGILSTVFFFRRHFGHYLGRAPPPPSGLAQGRSIDIGIQFLLFWMPFLVLVAWFTHKPLSLLFDIFEVAVLLGACFLVNHVTADAKTNWTEGMMMMMLYFMIAITVWFYPGQTDIQHMQTCETVADSLAEPSRNALLKINTTLAQKFVNNNTAIQILNDRLQQIIDLHNAALQH
ncbi:hypothetical protein C0995_013056 [Termitomyces sp. Mi166|nr:hypothetical protein C0995_013056 [Termitomyces sp. Mi166\